jgi:hypothetical protein
MAIRSRFILRYTGAGPSPHAHVVHLKSVPGTKVIDASDKMLLVEGRQRDLESFAHELDGWVVAPEKTIPVPDTRKRIKRRVK